ncbi:MAG TPA: TonB-dependent receptor [Marinilabiliales bacterium]|nr:TonB-dependent receptor [Marinilabiliales bacterium]
MKKKILLFACLLTTLASPFAANVITQTIRGAVTDATTGFPLIGATVVLLNSEPVLGTTSDVNGNFELKNVPLGRQSIQISYLGYKPQQIPNILVNSGKEILLQIPLEEDITVVAEITVKAENLKEKALNEMAPVSARSFSIEQTERFAGSLGDPSRMVANYAGVAMQNDARNDIVIRGDSPAGVIWRLEGVEIANPNHFGASGTTGGPVSMINNNMLSNSDFLTGAFPAEFGNGISGAFDLNMRSGNNSTHEFTGQVGFNGFEFGAEGPLFSTQNQQKASYLANYRYSTLEVMSDLGFNIGTGTAVPEYKDFTFMADVPGTKAGRFKIFGLWGKSYIALGRDYSDTSENAYNGRGTATNFGADLWMVGSSHTYFFNDKTSLVTTLSYQSNSSSTVHDSVRNKGAEIMPFVRAETQENKLSVNSQFRYKWNAKNNFYAGITIDQYEVSGLDSINLYDYQKFIKQIDVKGTVNFYQGYAQWQHKFNNALSTFAGLHTQYYQQNQSLAVEPRLGLSWEINTQHSLNAGFGMHSQMQSKLVYFIQSYDSVTNTYSTTNNDLDFTKSNHYVLGYNYKLNDHWHFKAETYYQNLYNIPIKESFPEFSMINSGSEFAFPTEDSLINEGTGKNYGLELTMERFLNNGYYFLFTGSIFNSTYKGYDKKERNTAYNGNYVFNMLAGYEYKFSEKYMLTFDIKGTLAGGKRYIPVDLEQSLYSGSTEYNYNEVYENKYKDYFRTDLRIGFKHNGKRFSQEWGLDLQNITNYKSVYMEQYDVENNEVYQIYQQGFMPMMLYRIQF